MFLSFSLHLRDKNLSDIFKLNICTSNSAQYPFSRSNLLPFTYSRCKTSCFEFLIHCFDRVFEIFYLFVKVGGVSFALSLSSCSSGWAGTISSTAFYNFNDVGVADSTCADALLLMSPSPRTKRKAEFFLRGICYHEK